MCPSYVSFQDLVCQKNFHLLIVAEDTSQLSFLGNLPFSCWPQEVSLDPQWSFQTSPLIALVQVLGNYSAMFEVPEPVTP